jgi:transcriptional regulator with XRE-family HTH domain
MGTLPMSERGFGPNSVDAQVGYNVRAKRTELSLWQEHVARQLGLTLAEYQERESGMRRFGAERLSKLARLMDISPNYFFETSTRP